MIIPRVYAENFWANLDKYVDEKYIIDDGKQHFVRNRKTTQESIMKYLNWLGIEESQTYDIIKKIDLENSTHINSDTVGYNQLYHKRSRL